MYLIIKRLFDLIFSITAIILLLPIFTPIIIILLLTGEHKVFYFQKRIGYNNREFYIWKFATMLKDSPNIGTGEITLRKDPRVTWAGGFLRMSKLNELPQLINVLKGDMSFVGARPLTVKAFNLYSPVAKDQVYNTRPGITGIGSIVFRDEEKLLSESSLPPHEYYALYISPYKGALEIWYQKNISFLTDLLILFLTAWSVIFPGNKIISKFFKTLPQRTF